MKNHFSQVRAHLPLLLLAIWVMYLAHDFAFRHGHVTSDGRYFSHVHYNKEKDNKHTHTEDEFLIFDVISNLTYLDAVISEFSLADRVHVPSQVLDFHYTFISSISFANTNPLRGPPHFA